MNKIEEKNKKIKLNLSVIPCVSVFTLLHRKKFNHHRRLVGEKLPSLTTLASRHPRSAGGGHPSRPRAGGEGA